jgi:hypothetical protein
VSLSWLDRLKDGPEVSVAPRGDRGIDDPAGRIDPAHGRGEGRACVKAFWLARVVLMGVDRDLLSLQVSLGDPPGTQRRDDPLHLLGVRGDGRAGGRSSRVDAE